MRVRVRVGVRVRVSLAVHALEGDVHLDIYAWGGSLEHLGLQPGHLVLQSTCSRAACTALYIDHDVHHGVHRPTLTMACTAPSA